MLSDPNTRYCLLEAVTSSKSEIIHTSYSAVKVIFIHKCFNLNAVNVHLDFFRHTSERVFPYRACYNDPFGGGGGTI